jgi:hypothetical protein
MASLSEELNWVAGLHLVQSLLSEEVPALGVLKFSLSNTCPAIGHPTPGLQLPYFRLAWLKQKLSGPCHAHCWNSSIEEGELDFREDSRLFPPHSGWLTIPWESPGVAITASLPSSGEHRPAPSLLYVSMTGLPQNLQLFLSACDLLGSELHV